MHFLLMTAILACAATSAAIPVYASAPDGVAAIYADGGALFALGTDGRSWTLVMANLTGWLPTGWPGLPPGVAVEQVADWSVRFLTTSSGARWEFNLDPDLLCWVLIPPLPSAPVPAHGSSLGHVKGLFR